MHFNQKEYNKKLDRFGNILLIVRDNKELMSLLSEIIEFLKETHISIELIKRENLLFEINIIVDRLENEGYDESGFLEMREHLLQELNNCKSTEKTR